MKIQHLTTAALALLFAACGNEEIVEGSGSGTTAKVPMTFTAGGAQTRTSLQPADEEGQSAVHWTAGDAIAIWDGTATNKFTTEDAGATAKFTGEVTEGSTAYTAFYPYTADGTLTFTDGTLTFTLPAAQTAKVGSFAEGLNPSWAQDTDGSHKLEFQNLCALAKFTVGTDGVTEVVLTANGDDDALAGSLTYTIGAGGAEGTLKAAEEGASRSVTLTGTKAAEEGASRSVTLTGTFESGKTYYFVVAPGTLAGGITLRYTGGDGKTYVKTTSNPVAFTAGVIADLGNVNNTTEAGFSEALNPAFAAALMDNCPEVSLTKNPDGTASLTNYIKGQMFTVRALHVNGCSLTSLAGIEYFTLLEVLDCDNNNLTTLDVSKLERLLYLYCSNNDLTALDVSNQTELINLTCYNNQMTALDITQNTALESLLCGQQKEGKELTLKLLDTQQGLWNKYSNYDENERVTPDYQ